MRACRAKQAHSKCVLACPHAAPTMARVRTRRQTQEWAAHVVEPYLRVCRMPFPHGLLLLGQVKSVVKSVGRAFRMFGSPPRRHGGGSSLAVLVRRRSPDGRCSKGHVRAPSHFFVHATQQDRRSTVSCQHTLTHPGRPSSCTSGPAGMPAQLGQPRAPVGLS